MTRDRLWMALAFLVPALAATIAPMSTVDLAYNVRAGELMLGAGSILREDPFTFTAAGAPWLNQQWGVGVLFAAVHGTGGWGGLVVLRLLLVAASVGLLAVAARRWLGWRAATPLAFAGFLVAIASLGLRAQLLGIVLFAATLAILAWRDRRPTLSLAIPLLVLAWVNSHGSFFLGPAAVGVALADDLLARQPGTRRLAVVLAASLAVTFVTPFGPAVWAYSLGIATNPEITRLITEWQRTSPLTMTGALFYTSLAGALLVLLTARRQGGLPGWPTLAWLGGLAFLGAYAQRGVAWWAVGAPVALAPLLAAIWATTLATWARLGPEPAALLAEPAAPRAEPGAPPAAPAAPRLEQARYRRLNAGLVIALAAAVVALQPLWRGGDPMAGPPGLLSDAPAGLARALAGVADGSDRAVVPQPWASWFIWAAPGVPVLVDSRVEVVPVSAWADYLTIVEGGAAALATLDRLAASVVVVDSATQEKLGVTLRGIGSGWRLHHEDGDGALFVREPRAP